MNPIARTDGAAERPSSTAIRVLYADDDESMRGLVQDALADVGMTVVLASDGREATELAVATSPDVIVTDLRMPDGGLEYVARLRREVPGIPVILVTAFGAAGVRMCAAELGVSALLSKPVPMRELADAVRRAVRGSDRY
jgi:CheY-like chemotaxis protein